jgi:hypothetical protein
MQQVCFGQQQRGGKNQDWRAFATEVIGEQRKPFKSEINFSPHVHSKIAILQNLPTNGAIL